MINCAHPTHFDDVLEAATWRERIRGLRANASTRSHAELDEAEELDDGDPARPRRALRARCATAARAQRVGGCCGTDHRHVGEICSAWHA